jgi:hypothetical protein
MPSTTNFNWTTPADTDLVKDGASAIRTLGNSIDTSFVDLKGGTSGQVLAKNSNTDLDFTWIAVDPLTILDAKGDLISATAADTPARLAVGTNGQILTVDSTTATGLKWATPAGGGKVLQVVQGTTSTNTAVAGNTFADTTLSASITPSSTSSKIMVLTMQTASLSGTTNASYGAMQLLRGATVIWTTAGYSYGLYVAGASSNTTDVSWVSSIAYLDSPATTSSTTYKTQVKGEYSNQTFRTQLGGNVSTMILMEIGA